MIPLTIQDQFYTSHNLQRSLIPQTSNWPGTFFLLFLTAKPALVGETLPRLSSMGSQELFLRLVSVLLLIGSCLDFSTSSSVLAPPCSTDKITKANACIGFSMSFSRIWLRILLDLNCLKVELFSTRVARVSGEDCPSDRVHA